MSNKPNIDFGWRTILWIALLAVGHMLYANDKSNIGVYLVAVSNQFGANLGLSGLISTVSGAGQALSGLLAGWLIAKNGSKSTLLIGLGVSSAGMVVSSFSTNAPQFLIMRVVVGFGQGFWIVAYTAFVGFVFAKARGFAIAAFLAMYDMGLVWGNPLSGFLVQATSNWRVVPITFGGLGLILLAVSLWAIPQVTSKTADYDERPKFTAAMYDIFKNRDIWLAMTISLVWSLVFFAVLGLLPTYVSKAFGFSTLDSAVLTSFFSLGSLLSGPPVAALSDKLGRKGIMLASGVATTITVFVLFDLLLKVSFLEAGVAIFAVGVAQVAGYSVVSSFIQDSLAANLVGYAMGFLNLIVSSGAAISGLLLGIVASVAGWGAGGVWLAACGTIWCGLTLLIRQGDKPTLGKGGPRR